MTQIQIILNVLDFNLYLKLNIELLNRTYSQKGLIKPFNFLKIYMSYFLKSFYFK